MIKKIKRMKLVKVLCNKKRREYLIASLILVALLPISVWYSLKAFAYGIGQGNIYGTPFCMLLIVVSFGLFIFSFFIVFQLELAYYKIFGKKRKRYVKRARRRR